MKIKVVCASCGKRYSIDSEKIPSSGARIKCPKCKGIIVVNGSFAAVPSADFQTAVEKAPAIIPPSRKETEPPGVSCADAANNTARKVNDTSEKISDSNKEKAAQLGEQIQPGIKCNRSGRVPAKL